jgi:hypothetical protein
MGTRESDDNGILDGIQTGYKVDSHKGLYSANRADER